MAGELIARCRKRLASGFELDVSLVAPLEESRVTVLFGPSGSGKTTLLRVLAGLDRPDAGIIALAGSAWFDSTRGIDLPPQKRRAAFLSQDYALFPHLTVAENVAFAAQREAASALLKRFGLAELSDRLPHALSGGQQQRVALVRALASRPALMLADEPLSALDAATRARTRQELRRLLVESGVRSIVVTHDHTEAIALGDWMAVMVAGRIRQAGPVREVFRYPADAAVAECAGVENVLPAGIVSRESGLVTIAVAGVRLDAVDRDGGSPAPVPDGAPLFACIRGEDVAIARGQAEVSTVRNRLHGRVRGVTVEGPLARVELDCGFPLVAVVTTQSAAGLELKPGDSVYAVVKTTALQLVR
jgi:molybdate transport system ATP-binding protein